VRATLSSVELREAALAVLAVLRERFDPALLPAEKALPFNECEFWYALPTGGRAARHRGRGLRRAGTDRVSGVGPARGLVADGPLLESNEYLIRRQLGQPEKDFGGGVGSGPGRS
jgi:hypothetical protein